jgi:hypothetical protein
MHHALSPSRSKFPDSRRSSIEGGSRRAQRIRTGGAYSGGVIRPDAPLDFPEDARLRLTIDLEPEPAAAPKARTRRLEWALFALALLVYAFTHLWALERFPIYFFADEATHALLADDLIHNGFKDRDGNLLPLYFEAAGLRWTPLLSVYVHALPVALFGKSITETRATSALVTVLGAAALALTMKLIFRSRVWWAAVLFLALAPNWLLHARTGFETVMMASFYACFLLYYLLYRTRSPGFLYPAVAFGAATFYTYSNGQMVMAATAVFLALSDVRYHLRNWRTVLGGLALAAILLVPLLRFRLAQPDSLPQHLRAIDSYWFRDLPLADKLTRYAQTYLYGLSPQYWFAPNDHDLVRHRVKGLGHLGVFVLPFFVAGLVLCLARIRSAPHRAVLLAALAAPAGAALVDISITRVMAFNVPAVLFCTLGLDAVLLFLEGRFPALRRAAPWPDLAVFGVMSLASLLLFRYVLTGGPTWFGDYGLYGMQYGARQLFQEAIPEYLRRDPDTRIMVTSTWANGADAFVRFFLPKEDRSRVQMLNVDHYLEAHRDLGPDTLLVMTPSEYDEATRSPKFKSVEVDRVVPYPDGRPGFHFARLAYADNIEEVMAEERAARERPVVEAARIDGQTVQVTHSLLDAGQMSDLFDGDPFTLVRGMEANPLIFEFVFPEPRTASGLKAAFGSMDFVLSAFLYGDESAEPVAYSGEYRGLPPDPSVELAFDRGPAKVVKLRLEILKLGSGPEAKIHVRDLGLLP